jgi:hypothetical protein
VPAGPDPEQSLIRPRYWTTLAVALVAILLAGCGGGRSRESRLAASMRPVVQTHMDAVQALVNEARPDLDSHPRITKASCQKDPAGGWDCTFVYNQSFSDPDLGGHGEGQMVRYNAAIDTNDCWQAVSKDQEIQLSGCL